MNKTKRSWKKLLIITLITAVVFFLLSYDVMLTFGFYLFIILAIGIFATFIFLMVAISTSISFKQFPPKWTFISCIVLIGSMPLNYFYRNGFFWGKKITEAAFLDDRSRMDLTLFENGKFLIKSNWFFGEESFTGEYHINGDTIEFNKYPVVNNDFVAKRIIKNNNKIYFKSYGSGKYDTTFYYFQIDFDKHR